MNQEQGQNLSGDILIVDDTPINVRLLSSILTKAGYEVRQAFNGEMALTAALTTPPALILLDIMMPDMDGYEVCEYLKNDPKTCHIPVIFVSALDSNWYKEKAFEVGGVEYITKPFKVVEILNCVATQLGGSSQ